MSSGRLVVIGTGIQFIGHMTLAAQAWLGQADKVLFAMADPAMAKWIREHNPTAETLPYNRNKTRRKASYREIVAKIMQEVRQGGCVCVVLYGHPGVFAEPAHAAIKQARLEGFKAQMLPGISAEDCLFADLGIDPGQHGCQSFEATDFLIRQRKFDPTSVLILWQIAMIGNLGFEQKRDQDIGTQVLVEALTSVYGPEHIVTVYEAAVYPTLEPLIQQVPLKQLPTTPLTEVSTLYVPPKMTAPVQDEMLIKLGIEMPVLTIP